jgi:formyl-CoA transferase
MSPPAFAIARDAPAHGEHTRDVLREAGYGDAAIDALLRERAVTSAS